MEPVAVALRDHLLWRVDGLALVFLVPMAVVVLVAAAVSPSYLAQERYRDESGWRYALAYALFSLGMAAAVLAADLLLFLVAWEVMTLASYVLVAHETRDPATLRAAFKYFVMTHVGAAGLLFAAILLGARGGSFAFASLPATFGALAAAEPVTLHLVLALIFLGFATKAGLWPFGDWLPDAHPAAPAPVSAVLSGVMVKLGLYGFLRVFVQSLGAADPAAAATWGHVLVGSGLLSALVGGAAAAGAMDVKVLLAHSSVAQSGLISVGVGAALVLAPSHPALAALALLGAAFHTVTDAAVKALLFLSAGALQTATGSRRLDQLGGLFAAMPATATAALVGAFALAGFPPLTAFTGKWLLLQSTVLSREPWMVAAGTLVLLASLLSVLYAVRFYAAAFATRPMRPGRLPVPAPLERAQLALAGVVIALGLLPGPLLGLLERALRSVAPWSVGPVTPLWGEHLLATPGGAYAPLVVVALAAWAVVLGVSALGRGPAAEPRALWTGGVRVGEPAPHPYGLYQPVRDTLHRASPRVRWPRPALPAGLPTTLDADRWFYRPALGAARRATEVLRRAHTGVPHVYLAWQLAGALALALLFVLLLRR